MYIHRLSYGLVSCIFQIEVKLWLQVLPCSLHDFFFSLLVSGRVGCSFFPVVRLAVQGAIVAAFSLRGLNLFIATSNKRNFNMTRVVRDLFSQLFSFRQILLVECRADTFQSVWLLSVVFISPRFRRKWVRKWHWLLVFSYHQLNLNTSVLTVDLKEAGISERKSLQVWGK